MKVKTLRTRKHMDFQQRREQIIRNCLQLKADVDSYNDNREPYQRIELVWDFTKDLAELESWPGEKKP